MIALSLYKPGCAVGNKNKHVYFVLRSACTIFANMNGELCLLDVRNLTVAYNKNVVIHDFSMQLHRGELVAVTGTSGSGKSSLLRALMGFVPNCSGVISLDGVSMRNGQMEKLRRRTAYLPQDLSFPCEWVSEVIEPPFLFKCNKKVSISSDRWLATFERLGLDRGIISKRVNEISGGQRQRMMFAVIAMLDKDIVLLDEPTSALDGESISLVVDFIKDMCRAGKAVLAVTHDRFFASICDRIIEF